MKKLMFAAAFAAVTGVSQAACGLPGAAACTPPVWDFQMMLRADTLCVTMGDGQGLAHCGLAGVCGCYRELQTLTYAGVWYICDCGCEKIMGGANINWDIADMTRKIKYADATIQGLRPTMYNQVTTAFQPTKAWRFGAYAEKFAAIIPLVSVYTARANDPAAWGNLNLQLAGFGAWPLEQQYFQTLAGYVTGEVDASKSCADFGAGANATPCAIFDLCLAEATSDGSGLLGVVKTDPSTWLTGASNAELNSIAYGQFQVKYNAAAAARFQASFDSQTGNYNIATIIPSWF